MSYIPGFAVFESEIAIDKFDLFLVLNIFGSFAHYFPTFLGKWILSYGSYCNEYLCQANQNVRV